MATEKKKDIQKKKNKIEFKRDASGNLYAVKNGKTIDRITTSGDERKG